VFCGKKTNNGKNNNREVFQSHIKSYSEPGGKVSAVEGEKNVASEDLHGNILAHINLEKN